MFTKEEIDKMFEMIHSNIELIEEHLQENPEIAQEYTTDTMLVLNNIITVLDSEDKIWDKIEKYGREKEVKEDEEM